MTTRIRYQRPAGFTLVEVVLAIGIVTAVMIPLVALLSHGIDHAQHITVRDKALRLVPAVEQKLNSMPFSQAKLLADSNGAMYAYVYRASPAAHAAGGPGAATSGQDAFVAVARPLQEAGSISTEAGSIEGPMFRIDLARVRENSNQPTSGAGSAAEASVEFEARFSRVFTPARWQVSRTEHQMTLRFVVNR